LSGGEKKEGREVSSPLKTGSWKGGKTEMAGYNTSVRTAGVEKKFVFGRNAFKIAIF
jgi:hypothetical protein